MVFTQSDFNYFKNTNFYIYIYVKSEISSTYSYLDSYYLN